MRSTATSASPAVAVSTVCSSALRARPNACLFMLDDLLGKIQVAGCALAFRVVEKNRFAETRRLGQADVARNDGGKNLVAEKVAQVVAHLARKIGAIVVHGQQNSFHCQLGVVCPPNADQRIEQ